MRLLCWLAGSGAFIAVTSLSMQAQAQDYDMDCKVILCLAGGFPATCSDAKSYMLNRLKKGKSPFGACTYEDGGTSEAVKADARFLLGKEGHLCEPGKKLFYEQDDDNHLNEVFCYSNLRSYHQGGELVTIYEGKEPATFVNFTTQITVEPGSAEAFTSPRYYVNTGDGTVIER
ncbi:hypothetical protein [Roseibium suaedae]|uniref:Uncharacterized protein n=1 Tax=Roseibium suaedae TaxID=735517 RepID=A0A1M7PIU7_9HYPH|nr:hypothetical protein [Roseibium suaedae]SHN17001.1 hypothetical protein SAMN05444272_4444 [Roseibium suaedae]